MKDILVKSIAYPIIALLYPFILLRRLYVLLKPKEFSVIEVYNTKYRADDIMQEEKGMWLGAEMSTIDPLNAKEWWYHEVLKKHITYGQPYCVACGKRKIVNRKPPLKGN